MASWCRALLYWDGCGDGGDWASLWPGRQWGCREAWAAARSIRLFRRRLAREIDMWSMQCSGGRAGNAAGTKFISYHPLSCFMIPSLLLCFEDVFHLPTA